MPDARSALFGFHLARPRLVRIRLVPGYQVKSVVTMLLKVIQPLLVLSEESLQLYFLHKYDTSVDIRSWFSLR